MAAAAQPTDARPDPWRTVAACCIAAAATWVEPPASIFRPPAELAFGSGLVGYSLLLGIIDLFVIVGFLVGGTLGDLFGRRRLLLLGLAGAVLGNALLLLSPNIAWFVATRVLVGVAGALVLPLSLGLVHLAFAGDGKQRDRAITRYVVSSALAALAAALLGGALRSLPDWRLAFVPPILLGLLAIVLVWRNVAESRALPHERYVVEGDSASTWVLLALAFGLHLYWVAGPYAIYVLLASLSAVALGAFVLLRSDYRASGLRLTLNWRRRWSRTVLTIFGVAMNIAVTGYLAQAHGALRVVYGYGGLVALLAMLPYVAGTLLVSRPVFQRGAARLGHRESMAAGLALVSLSCLATWLLFGAGSYLALALVMASFGIGSTMASSAWTASYLGAMSGELIGVRTGMNTAIGRTGDVVGMTLTTALLATVGSGDYLQRLRSEGVTEERIQRANEALNSLLHPATVAAVTTDPRIAEYLLAGYRLSYLVAFERVMLVLTVISLLASALAWVGLRSRESHAVISVATEQNR